MSIEDYPQNLPKATDWSKLWPTLGLAGLSGAAGAFPTPQQQNSRTTSQNNTDMTGFSNNYGSSDVNSLLQTLSNMTGRTSGSTTGSGNITPTLSPESATLMNQLIRQYSGTAGRAPDLSGYQAQQTRDINRGSDMQRAAVEQMLAARGLSNSPIAATAALNTDANRNSQISSLRASLPLLQNQLTQTNLGNAAGFFSTLPRGQVTSQDQRTLSETSQDTSGSQAGKTTGVTTSDQNFGQNSSNWQQQITELMGKSGGGIGGFLAGLAPILATLIKP